jgi:voltage-gated potassium channel
MLTLWSIFVESRHLRRIVGALVVFAAIHVLGTVGYLIIGPASTSVVDALYMTFITVATIGYAEVVDLTGHPGGRVFTMLIAFLGIGTMTFMFSSVTAFMLESDLNRAYRRRRMQAKIDQLSGHYLVCGAGRIGGYVLDELDAVGLRHVVVEFDHASAERRLEQDPRLLILEGDAADDDVLKRAGIERCLGVFAVTGDDSKNLVVSLSAKQLNPKVRVVARVHDPRNVAKTLRAGADEIVSPDFTGGHRIASLMMLASDSVRRQRRAPGKPLNRPSTWRVRSRTRPPRAASAQAYGPARRRRHRDRAAERARRRGSDPRRPAPRGCDTPRGPALRHRVAQASGGTSRFSLGDRPCSQALRACTMNTVQPARPRCRRSRARSRSFRRGRCRCGASRSPAGRRRRASRPRRRPPAPARPSGRPRRRRAAPVRWGSRS